MTANDNVLLVVIDFAVEFPMDRVPFQQMRERLSVGKIIDRAHVFDLLLRHRTEHVATDPSEAVDSVISHKQEGLNFEGFTP